MIRGLQAIMKIFQDCNAEDRKDILEAMQHVKKRNLNADKGQLHLLAKEIQETFHSAEELQKTAKAILKIIDEERPFIDMVSSGLRKSLVGSPSGGSRARRKEPFVSF